MAGIRVDTPKGDGWEYSLNQLSWQTSRKFSTKADGSPFVEGFTYVVYCRNSGLNVSTQESILFGSPSNAGSLPALLALATQAQRREAFLLLWSEVMADPTAKATVCADIATCPVSTPPPPPIFDQIEHFEFIPDDVTIPAPIFDQIEHFEFIPDNAGDPGTPPTPSPVQQRLDGNFVIYEPATGTETGNYHITNRFADDSETAYTGAGTYSLDAGYPNGVVLTNGSNATASIAVPTGCVSADVQMTLRFTFPDNRQITLQVTIVNQNPVIDPTANPPATSGYTNLHSNDFSGNFGTDPSNWTPGYATYGLAGAWNWGTGTLCQTDIASNPADHKAILYTANGSQSSANHTVTWAKVKPTRLNSDSRLGVGLMYQPGGQEGYCFVILDSGHVGFVHSAVSGGPSVAYTTEVGTWYWMKMIYEDTASNTCKVTAKIWKAGEVEPNANTIEWTGQNRHDGYPLLIGGYNDASACFDEWSDANYQTS